MTLSGTLPLLPERTLMHAEAAEAADAVARSLRHNRDALADLASRLRAYPPRSVVTLARGSSDHAATYGKYLFETLCGTPTASAGLSVNSVYAAHVQAEGVLCVAISQSGRSPDLLAAVEAYQNGGAHVVALVNDEASPLASLADTCLPLLAGPERSVAATKSFICSLAGLAAMAAHWREDDALIEALERLPDQLRAAFTLDWTTALPALATARNLFVIGRGYGLGIAQEAALKLKETCGLHAEAFSSAEVRHGPMAIVDKGFPVLAMATSDAAGDGVAEVCGDFAARGAYVWQAGGHAQSGVTALPAITDSPLLEPILLIQSFYRLVNALSVARGFDPDHPPHLNKVTRTL